MVRGFFRSSAGLVALLVVGLVIGAGGAATAAKLITGKDIKNGTITSADIKNGTIKGKDIKNGTITKKKLSSSVRSKLAATGTPGPKGDPGQKGDPGGLSIRDGGGNLLSGFVSAQPASLTRLVDGGLWNYEWDGSLEQGTVYYSGTDCTGTAMLPVVGTPLVRLNPQLRVFAGGQGYKPKDEAFQQAVTFNSARNSVVGAGCVNFSATFDLQVAELVSAPPPLQGPLTVVAN